MSSTPHMHTLDPVALRYLMTETIFDIETGPAKEATVQGNQAAQVDQYEKSPHFTYFGKNKRNYLFLTHEKQHEWMSDAAMEAFVKTLAALKLVADDVAVVNVGRLDGEPSAGELAVFFKPKVVVSLGAALAWPEQSDIQVLHTHSFEEMLADAEKKREFWTSIKTLLV